ncbi:MAG TPA: response regulator [Rhodocyclaceae bacterium]|nr:response regulator [Rhodocyclaceae bacterium]
MDNAFSIFIVDDAEATRRVLAATFGKIYDVESFESGYACLKRLTEKTPGLFLLDVGMPGMDGYELCRHIKNNPESKHVPVIFISALDDLESALKGYDAGADDFIVKPYKLAEVKQKIRLISERSNLRTKADESEMLATLILSNFEEYAVLVKFLRALRDCKNSHGISVALIAMLRSFRLDGAMQVRCGERELTLSLNGENRPLEVSIINHVRTLDKITRFKNRAAFNFAYVTVLINNMPLDDEELCHRLLEHMEVATEAIDSRLNTLFCLEENAQIKEQLADLSQIYLHEIGLLAEQFKTAQTRGAMETQDLLAKLSAQYAHMGITVDQEDAMSELVRSRTAELAKIFDLSEISTVTLQRTVAQLTGLLTLKERLPL